MPPITARFKRKGAGKEKAARRGVEAAAAPGVLQAGACPVYRYADFAHLVRPTGTAATYEELQTPLRHLVNRHGVLEGLVKLAYEQHVNGVASADILPAPATAKCVNGSARGRNCREYDYGVRRGGGALLRNEVKSGQLRWNKSMRYWVVEFQSVKLTLSDQLVLVLYAPDRILMFEFPSVREQIPGYSTHGVATKSQGGLVQWCGPRNKGWQGALAKFKKEKGAHLVATVQYTDPRYTHLFHNADEYQTPAEKAFAATPLSALSGKSRGDACEAVARKVDELQGRDPTDAADTSLGVDGRRRGGNATANDYDISGGGRRLRVEAKSAKPSWNTKHSYWAIQPTKIKADCFDVFRLAVPTPDGIDVYGCTAATLRPRLCTHGKATKFHGKKFEVTGKAGKKGDRCIRAALKTIHRKLVHDRGLALLARVVFD